MPRVHLAGPMLPLPRLLIVLALLAGASATAGCSFSDWYNQSGRFYIEIAPQGPENSSIGDFQRLKIAIYGVSMKQVGFVNTKEFSYADEPLVIDFLKAGREGERILVASDRMNIRAAEHVTVRLDIAEAVDAQGRPIPTCKLNQPTPATFPCFLLDDNNAYRLERQFSPPRGGEVTVGFPLSVKTVVFRGDTEYFLIVDPALATIETKK